MSESKPNPSVDSAILDRIKTILRRDLKLGTDVPIDDAMPFFGSDIDLDSLDMLLLVTSVEKEFGLKIPGDAVGREIFESVGSLGRYIQRSGGESSAPASLSPAPVPPADYLALLPHREPFRFITRVDKLVAGESAEGAWQLAGDESFFAGHFPGHPVVPGVLLTEALAQLSGLLAGPDPRGPVAGKLASCEMRFDRSVEPPASVTLMSRAARVMGALHQFEVEARVQDECVARGTVTLAIGGD